MAKLHADDPANLLFEPLEAGRRPDRLGSGLRELAPWLVKGIDRSGRNDLEDGLRR